MRIRRISILAPNLSQNNLGRAYLLAQVLKREYDVEILGPVFQERIWPPVDDGSVQYISVQGCNFPFFFGSIRKLLQKISGDVIYAVKPRLTSFGIALQHKRRSGIPVILDIDDLDYQGEYETSRFTRWARSVIRFPNPYSNVYLPLMLRQIHTADAITVASTELQRRFGGIFLPHCRDTATLNPKKFNRDQLRKQHNLTNKFVIMFFGTPRPHKGIEDVLKAIRHMDDPNLCYWVIGADWQDPYTDRLKAFEESRLKLVGMQPWTAIPEYLVMADLVVLAQRALPFSQAQVPAKVFDAMAMARPIIATTIGDLPSVLEGCALFVSPGDIQGIRDAIIRLKADQALAASLGNKARQRCIQCYSWDVMAHTLKNVLEHACT